MRDNLERPFRLDAVKREIAFDPTRSRHLLEALGLSHNLLDQDASLLSGGEAARMALVRALLLQPVILLLDEPTASLDQDAVKTGGYEGQIVVKDIVELVHEALEAQTSVAAGVIARGDGAGDVS